MYLSTTISCLHQSIVSLFTIWTIFKGKQSFVVLIISNVRYIFNDLSVEAFKCTITNGTRREMCNVSNKESNTESDILMVDFECMRDGTLDVDLICLSLLEQVNPDAGNSHLVRAQWFVNIRHRQGLFFWIQQVIKLEHRQEVAQLYQH